MFFLTLLIPDPILICFKNCNLTSDPGVLIGVGSGFEIRSDPDSDLVPQRFQVVFDQNIFPFGLPLKILRKFKYIILFTTKIEKKYQLLIDIYVYFVTNFDIDLIWQTDLNDFYTQLQRQTIFYS